MKQTFENWAKRALAALLAVSMALGTMPAPALAEALDAANDNVALETQATIPLDDESTYQLGDSVEVTTQRAYVNTTSSNTPQRVNRGTYALTWIDNVTMEGTTATHTFKLGDNITFKVKEPNGSNTAPDAIRAIRQGNYYTNYTLYPRYQFEILREDNKTAVSISGIAAQDKVYDGTTDVTLDCSTATVSGVAEDDDVQLDVELSGDLGWFEDEGVGKDKTVWFVPLFLTGKDAYKYKVDLSTSQISTTASITARPITITAKDDEATINGQMPAPATVDEKVSVSDDGLAPGQTLANVDLTYDPANTSAAKANGTVTPKDASITNDKGDDVTSNYAITYAPGTFRVDSIPTVNVEAAEGLVYAGRGNQNAQVLVKDTSTTNLGTLEYAVTTSATAAPASYAYAADLPKEDEAGTYYVWWRVQAGVDAEANTSWDAIACETPVEVTIAKKPVTFKGVKGGTRAYDGTLAAPIQDEDGNEVDLEDIELDGVLEDDQVGVALNADAAKAEFENKNAGENKPITFSGFFLEGIDYFIFGTRDYTKNYELVLPTGQNALKGTVTKRDVWVSGLKGVNKVYDATTKAEVQKDGTKFAVGNSVAGDDVDIDLQKTVANFAQADVAYNDKEECDDIDITFTPALTGADASNYNLVVKKGQTTAQAKITPRPITVKAKDFKAFWQREMPDVTSMTAADKATLEAGKDEAEVTYELLGSDVEVLGQVTIAFDPNTTTSVVTNGTATPSDAHIVDGKGTDVTKNYTIAYADGTLVVKKKHEDVVVEANEGLEYNKTAQALVTAKQKPEEGTIKYWVTTSEDAKPSADTTWSADVPTGTDAGTYYVWWGVEETNNYFELMSDAAIKVTIAPKTVGLKWANTKLTYTAKKQGPTATATGLAEGDVCDVTVAGAQKNAGTHTATATALSNPNYVLPQDPTGSFTIAKAVLTVTAKDKTIKFGAAPANAGVTYAGFQGSDKAKTLGGTLSYAYGSYKAGSKAGTYKITPSGLTSDNYKFKYVKGTLTVTAPASVAISGELRITGMGWLASNAKGIFGTTGKSLTTTGMKLKLASLPYSGGIQYLGHFQTGGWQQKWVSNGSVCAAGSKRFEAVQIKLTGNMAKNYDVYYRVHTQDLGWMAWAKNGAKAGTTHQSHRLESMQVVVLKKGSTAPGPTYKGAKQTFSKAFYTK